MVKLHLTSKPSHKQAVMRSVPHPV
jgi:hypothetical protein